MVSRRELLWGAGATALAGGGFAGGVLAAASAQRQGPAQMTMDIQSATASILDTPTTGLVSLSPDRPPPVIRLRQGEKFSADVVHTHGEPTAMHWHGLRVPNAMDGVPYLTQYPIQSGETFRYEFMSDDAGTYWYHPHCLTMEQMARGLTGILVVDEARDPGFDADLSLNLRDFRLNGKGEFIKLWEPRQAARGGTLGTVMTANWRQQELLDAPTGGIARLRVVATDVTRIYRLWLEGADGRVIAWDGHPLRTPIPWPSREEPLLLAAGQRAEFSVAMPETEGEEVRVMTMRAHQPHEIAKVRAVGANLARPLSEAPELPANPVPQPDLANAQVEEFVFGWSPEDAKPNYGLCGSVGYTFWSINRRPYEGDATPGLAPIATLQYGKSYIFRLRNESPNDHPVHLHGLTFVPLRSDKKPVRSNWTDTALLDSGETMDIAFVASNPGNWAFHCHIIEHQKTGLAGYIRIE